MTPLHVAIILGQDAIALDIMGRTSTEDLNETFGVCLFCFAFILYSWVKDDGEWRWEIAHQIKSYKFKLTHGMRIRYRETTRHFI